MDIIGFRENGSTSNIERVFLFKDSGATSGTEGDPITALTHDSTGLIISTIADGEATATSESVAGTDDIETIATLGTYVAPTSGKVRFKLVDAVNHPGLYEIQLADARFAVSDANYLDICISGATDLAAVTYRIWLDVLTAADLGLQYESTVSTLNSQLSVDCALAIATDDVWIGNRVTLEDADNSVNSHTTWVVDVDQANNRIILNDAAPWTLAVGDKVRVFADAHPGFHTDFQLSENTITTFDDMLGLAQLRARKDAAIFADRATLLGQINQDEGSGTGDYSPLTDSQQAIIFGVIFGTAATGTLSTTAMTTDLTGYLDDELIGATVVFTDGTADGQRATITDYASTSGLVTFSGGILTAPANGDTFKIV